MFAFFETANTEAWQPDEGRPSVMWFTLGGLKLKDLGILGAALPPGGVLRVVGRVPLNLAELETYCVTHGLVVGHARADRELTIFGCYAHYYVDIQPSPGASRRFNARLSMCD